MRAWAARGGRDGSPRPATQAGRWRERRGVTTYRALLAPRVAGAADELDGEDILPGLRIQVGPIFEPPRASEV